MFLSNTLTGFQTLSSASIPQYLRYREISEREQFEELDIKRVGREKKGKRETKRCGFGEGERR